jgi:hypothetical protein
VVEQAVREPAVAALGQAASATGSVEAVQARATVQATEREQAVMEAEVAAERRGAAEWW